MSKVTIGITSFFRDDCLKKVVRGIRANAGYPYEILIVDNGRKTKKRLKTLSKLDSEEDIKVVKLPYNAGIARCRNEMVKRSSSPFLGTLDNDLVPISQNFLKKMCTVLNSDEEIGAVAGVRLEGKNLRSDCCNLYLKRNGKVLIKKANSPLNCKHVKFNGSSLKLYEYEFIEDCTLWRRGVFKDYMSDPKYKIGMRHLDYFLAHKMRDTNWKWYVTPDILFKHVKSKYQKWYEEIFRYGKYREKSREYFKKKWKIQTICHFSSFIRHLSFTEALSKITAKLKYYFPHFYSLIKKLTKIYKQSLR